MNESPTTLCYSFRHCDTEMLDATVEFGVNVTQDKQRQRFVYFTIFYRNFLLIFHLKLSLG